MTVGGNIQSNPPTRIPIFSALHLRHPIHPFKSASWYISLIRDVKDAEGGCKFLLHAFIENRGLNTNPSSTNIWTHLPIPRTDSPVHVWVDGARQQQQSGRAVDRMNILTVWWLIGFAIHWLWMLQSGKWIKWSRFHLPSSCNIFAGFRCDSFKITNHSPLQLYLFCIYWTHRTQSNELQ